MLMKRFLILASVVTAALVLLLSCADKNTPGGGKFDVQFQVPESVTVNYADRVIDFRIQFGKAPVKSDKVVLGDTGGDMHICDIVSVSEKSFSVQLYEGVGSGHYGVYIQRGDIRKLMGEMDVTVVYDSGDDVVPEEGSSVYGKVHCDGKGIPDVVVSDGIEVVVTDEDGVYQMKSDKKYGYVFISLPSGYEPANEGILPVIYRKLEKSKDFAERADFPLFEAGDQTDHTMLVFGDMHLAARNNDRRQFSEFVTDVNSYVSANSSKKIYAVTLGDMTWDLYWYSNNYEFEQYLSDANAIKNLMVFHTIGNHDHDMEEAGDFATIFKYKKMIAPDYYSFNIGKVHYVVLDNIECTNDGTGDRTYNTKMTQEQLDWLEKDLAHVGKSTPVVVAMHATIKNMLFSSSALTGLLSGYEQVHFLTGHTHRVENNVQAKYFDHNSGAVCATWWWSDKLTPGIHIGQDGAPGGYQIFNIAGDDFSWQFKPTGRGTEYQFRTYDRNTMSVTADKYIPGAHEKNKARFDGYAKTWSSTSSANEVYINVWNYDPEWTIEVTENGRSLDVEKVSVNDPLHLIAYTAPAMKDPSKDVTPTFKTSANGHTFKVTASDASSTLEIKVTDRFGNIYTETMARPKTFSAATYAF